MATLIYVGVNHSNVGGKSSKAYAIRRFGRSVLIRYGPVELIGHAGGMYQWLQREPRFIKKPGFSTIKEAADFIRARVRDKQRKGYDLLPGRVTIAPARNRAHPHVNTKEYEVALSFAGEDRAYVDMVADQLRARGVSLFYDKYGEADLWGRDLYTHLVEVYMKRARYTLMFISVHYKIKVWTNHERRAAQARALQESGEYILPARFDDTEVAGILPTMAFLDLRQRSPAEVAVLLCDKLGKNPLQQKAHAIPSLRNPGLTGSAKFNYASHDGRFRIGDGQHEFETIWSKAGKTSIYCYTDTPSLRGVALAPSGANVNEISDASTLDYTSRARCPELGRVVVLQNTHGLFAALRIISIKNDSRGDAEDELQFHYWILTDGSGDFSGVSEPQRFRQADTQRRRRR